MYFNCIVDADKKIVKDKKNENKNKYKKICHIIKYININILMY